MRKITSLTVRALYCSFVVLWSPLVPNDLFICFELRICRRCGRVVAWWECWSPRAELFFSFEL